MPGAGSVYDVRKDFRGAGCREGEMLIWREVETWKERESRDAARGTEHAGVTLGLTTAKARRRQRVRERLDDGFA